MEIEMVPVDRLIPDPENPRKYFDLAEDAELAASIAAHDVKVPLICYRVPAGIMIGDGHRRHGGAKAAGKKVLPAIVFPKKPSEAETLLAHLVINGQRSDLNPVDRYEGYARLAKLNSWSNAELATGLSVSAAKVSSVLALGKLADHERELVRQGRISESAAYALARMEPEERAPLVTQAAAGELTRDQLNAKAKRPSKTDTAKRQRVSCPIKGGTVTVHTADGLTLTSLIELLEELVRHCRKAKGEGLNILTAVRVFRDRAEAQQAG